jgi:hypothetical protein
MKTRFMSTTFSLALVLGAGVNSAPANATQIGEILACYACQNTGNSAIDSALATGSGPAVASDGLLFAFVNTSGSAITGGVFSETGSPNDSFALPTLAANSTFILIPGVTLDGGSHPRGGLFGLTGVMDTSDGDGGLTDSTIFSFTGVQDALTVTSGTFTPGDSNLIKPWISPSGGRTSFIGQGPNGDPGCTNCYFGQIATLDVAAVVPGVPEPGTLALLGTALGGFGLIRRRRNRNLT